MYIFTLPFLRLTRPCSSRSAGWPGDPPQHRGHRPDIGEIGRVDVLRRHCHAQLAADEAEKYCRGQRIQNTQLEQRARFVECLLEFGRDQARSDEAGQLECVVVRVHVYSGGTLRILSTPHAIVVPAPRPTSNTWSPATSAPVARRLSRATNW